MVHYIYEVDAFLNYNVVWLQYWPNLNVYIIIFINKNRVFSLVSLIHWLQ